MKTNKSYYTYIPCQPFKNQSNPCDDVLDHNQTQYRTFKRPSEDEHGSISWHVIKYVSNKPLLEVGSF